MMIWPRCSELLCMDPADLAVFFPFLFLEMPNPNLWPAERAGPALNFSKNGPGYTPGSNLDEAVPSLQISGIKVDFILDVQKNYTYDLVPMIGFVSSERRH